MATKHTDVAILAAEPTGHGVVIHFSDGTTTFFQTHFLYKVRGDNGNVAMTDMCDDDLLKGFDE